MAVIRRTYRRHFGRYGRPRTTLGRALVLLAWVLVALCYISMWMV
jgi:hypothetical protein